jgi:hypothetical protein
VRSLSSGARRSPQRAKLHYLDAADGLAHLDCGLEQRVAAKEAQLEDEAVSRRQAAQRSLDPRRRWSWDDQLIPAPFNPHVVGELGLRNQRSAGPERGHH